MNKRSLDVLERVFEAEIDGAMRGGLGLYQSKAKLAQTLVEDGYLAERELRLPGRFPITVCGYVLTDLGRLTYYMAQKEG